MHLTHLPLVPHICVSESGQHVYHWCVQCFDTDNSVQYILMSLFSNKQHPCKKELAKTRKGFISETHFRLNIANGHNDNGWINCIVTSHERHGILNYRPFESLFYSLFKFVSKKASKLRIPGPLWRKSTSYGGFPSQRAKYKRVGYAD